MWALGLVAYQLLSGRPSPFTAPGAEALAPALAAFEENDRILRAAFDLEA